MLSLEYFLHEIHCGNDSDAVRLLYSLDEQISLLDKSGRKVWKHKSKLHPYYLVWDSLHGEIEVFYQKTLKHRAIYYPNGDYKGDAVKGRVLFL